MLAEKIFNRLELVRYILAGGTAFLLDFLVFTFFVNVFQVHYLVSNVIGYAAGLLLVYYLNSRWVFSVRRFDQNSIEFSIFFAIAVVGLFLSEIFIWLFAEQFLLTLSLSKILSAALVFGFNFVLRKIILFSKPVNAYDEQ